MFTRPIRVWIYIAQIFGTIATLIGLAAFGAYFQDVQNAIRTSVPAGSDVSEPIVITSLIMAIISYAMVKAIINAAVIINACSKMDDLTLSANKWIISSLSLTVGGFFTPFIMQMFPNVSIKGTIKPKVFLSRVYGWTLMIGSAVFMIVFGACSGSNLVGNTTSKAITEAFFIINGLMLVLGVTLVALFTRKDANEVYENNLGMRIFANFTTAIVTAELVIMLVWNFIEIFASVYDAFANSRSGSGSVNFFIVILAMLNLFVSVLYIGYLTQITVQTISGLWKNQTSYTVFEPLQKHTHETQHWTAE